MFSFPLNIALALGVTATVASVVFEDNSQASSLVMQGSLVKADQFPDMNSVNASITYWDIDDDTEITDKEKNAWKLEILNELLNNINHCTCPKLLGPFVCDNNRKLHSNLCYFKCVQGQSDPAIRPMMILAIRSFTSSKEICTNRI